MRIALSIGLAILCLTALLSAGGAFAAPGPRLASAPVVNPPGPSAPLSGTAPYSAYLPLLYRPHACRLTPCLVSVETFDSEASGWPTHTWDVNEPIPPGPHEMTYTGGAYLMYFAPAQWYRMMASVSPITHPQNTIIDVQARWTEFHWSNGYGLIFGADAPYSPTHFYAAVVSCLGEDECNWNHVILWRIDNFEQFASHQPAGQGQPPNPHARVELTPNTLCVPCKTKFNTWNQIRIIRDGPTIVVQVNGSSVLTATDSTYMGPGYVGLLVENFENTQPTDGEIDNVTVTDLGPSGN